MLESMNTHSLARRSGGLTLIELLVVMALLAVIATLAAPSFTGLLAKKRVEGITAELVTDLQYARSEAVQRNEIVRVTFGAGCYVIHTQGYIGGATCSASGPSVVTGGSELKTVQIDGGSTASLSPNAGLAYIQFEALRGSPDASGSIDVNSSVGGWQLRAIVSAVGRVRTCSPNASIAGYSNECS
jgi:type IV fimbrial biogenesis protein FimT